MGKTSTDSKRRYNEKVYDRVSLSIPKGGKDVIRQAAERASISSINSYILNAINKQLHADGFPALVTEAEKKSHQ